MDYVKRRIENIVTALMSLFEIDVRNFLRRVRYWSLLKAQEQQSFSTMTKNLSQIVPDISQQYSSENIEFNAYWELKIRLVHAFQVKLMLKAIEDFSEKKLVVVDIGDSSGTHMLYLKELTKKKLHIDTVSVNLDSRAIGKIQAHDLKAILKRAEDIQPEDIDGEVDLFTSFEMAEHLHNPAVFFRRIAKRTSCKTMVISVPYLRRSRIGLHHIRNRSKEITSAENEHIFELSPRDWRLLFLHSGWRVTFSDAYFQYPKQKLFVSPLLRFFWAAYDFEGFWGAILRKDMAYSDRYQDWEE